MIRRTLLGVAFVMAVPAAAPASASQTVGVTTGALNGTVTDASRNGLAEVSVAVTGDTMIGSRSTTTDARGRFEIPAVPPGRYTVRLSLPGFAPVSREHVDVNVGATSTVDAVLHVAAQEAVAVSGRTALVDRSGTAIAINFDAQQLADLPSSRSMNAILAATPHVQLTRFDVGGNAAFEPGPFSAYGTTGLNRPTLEGINISGHNPLAFTLDHGSFEHISVNLGAHGPEWAWPGVHVQYIARSGGNRHRGSVYLDYEHRGWQSSNIDDEQIQRGAAEGAAIPPRETNQLWRYRDANADAGGPLRKDLLWWYGSIRDQEVSARQVRFPVEPVSSRASSAGGKATARTSGDSRFVAFAQGNWNRQPHRLDGFLNPAAAIHKSRDSTTEQNARGVVWKTEWNASLTSSAVLEVLGGQFVASRRERPNSALPRTEDITTLEVSGGNRDWAERLRRDQIFSSVTVARTGPFGSHHVRVGGEIQRIAWSERWFHGFLDNVLHVTSQSTPHQVYLFEAPSASLAGLQLYAAHANDTWRVTDRLTLNLGLRFDRARAFLPAQEHPAGAATGRTWPAQPFEPVANLIAWNVVAPRIAVSRILSGDARTVLKASYGRYWLPLSADTVFNANPNTTGWWERARWIDLDQDGGWDPGEDVQLLERRGGQEVESRDRHLRPSFTREATARILREVGSFVRIETGIVWRGLRDPSARQNLSQPFSGFTRAVTVPDRGADGQFATPDDRSIIVFDLEQPAAPAFFRVANVPGAANDHVTWEVTADRRLSGRWSLMAGFSHTWVREHASGYFGQNVRANTYALTPNDLIHTGDGGRHEFRVWSARAHGTYQGPWGLRITPFLRHQSGQPFGRTLLVTGLNVGSVRVLAEPIGARRTDHVTLLDLRGEKAFAFSAARRVSLFVDVYNLLNANPEQNVNWSSDRLERPLVIVPPRIARAGVKLAW